MIPLLIEIYGNEGVGKTHLSLTAPNPAIVDLTAKGESLPIAMKLHKDWQKRYFRSRDFDTTKNIVDQLARSDFSVVIFDTSVDLKKQAEAKWRKEHGKDRIYPITLYGEVYDMVDSLTFGLMEAGKDVIMISQTKDEYIDGNRTGKRIWDGYARLPFQADIRIAVVLRDVEDRVVQGNRVHVVRRKERHYIVVKNRFMDPTKGMLDLTGVDMRSLVRACIPEEVIEVVGEHWR